MDTSWQRKLAAVKGQFVASAALRRIEDVILDRLIVQPAVASAPWLLQRFNGGRAWAASLELEASGQTATPLLAKAPLRWQASLALHRSWLRNVAGPQPALAGQAPWQLKRGPDPSAVTHLHGPAGPASPGPCRGRPAQ